MEGGRQNRLENNAKKEGEEHSRRCECLVLLRGPKVNPKAVKKELRNVTVLTQLSLLPGGKIFWWEDKFLARVNAAGL